MRVVPTQIPDVLVLEPEVYRDERGLFFESYNKRAFAQAAGVEVDFVQDNHSRSARGVLRGLHYQVKRPQGKLVRVIAGEIWDVALDLRRSSPTFGKWTGIAISAESRRSVWIPPGFAHGFLVTSETAEVLYKATDYYAPEHERTVRWNDPQARIDWPVSDEPTLSDKDRRGAILASADTYD